MNVKVQSIRIGKKYRIKKHEEANSYHALRIGSIIRVIAAGYDHSINQIVYLCEGPGVPNGDIIQNYVLSDSLEEF